MANNDSDVRFEPDNGNMSFEPESGLGESRSSWRSFGGDNFSWNKAVIGVGAAAAVAGAAYAATRFIGRGGSSDESERSERRERESALT